MPLPTLPSLASGSRGGSRTDVQQPVMREGTDGPYRDGYANPESSTPAPAPLGTLRPVGYWESEPTTITWGAVAGGGVQGFWGTTVFDLRTDLRAVSSRDLAGTPVNRASALQIWVAIGGLLANHLGLSVAMAPWGHPVDATKVRQFLPWADVTADTATGTDLAILNYWPPGTGYQMRFWQLQLRFAFSQPLAALPSLQVQGGVY